MRGLSLIVSQNRCSADCSSPSVGLGGSSESDGKSSSTPLCHQSRFPARRALFRHVGDQTEDADRLRNVLDALLAEILEAVGELAPDMVVNAARDADAAGLGQPLDTRGDIDAIAEDVAVLHHDIADIDADAKPHTALFTEGQVGLGKIMLDLNGALYGGNDAGEFGENAVTGRAADPAAMLL